MPIYLWSGKDKHGNPIAQRLETQSAAEAKQLLVERGYTDLELHTEEIAQEVHQQMGGKVHEFSAEEELKFRQGSRKTWPRIIVKIFKESRQLFTIVVLLCSLFAYLRQPLGFAICLGIGLWFFGYCLWVSLPGYLFSKLNEATEWHRWKQVLQIVTRIQCVNQLNLVKLPDSALARYRAAALAGLGRLEEGVTEYQKYENTPGLPRWLFLGLIAGIYDVAHDYDRALNCNRQSLCEKHSAAMALDLAWRLIYRKQDVIGARQAMAEADKSEPSVLGKPFLKRCTGLIAYEERDYTTAQRDLEESLRLFRTHIDKPFVVGNIRLTQGLLCLCHAKLGDQPTAKRHFAECKEFLKAIGEDELLRNCELAVGTQSCQTPPGFHQL
jgi:tetratricopeptide (TPR) repeat protein